MFRTKAKSKTSSQNDNSRETVFSKITSRSDLHFDPQRAESVMKQVRHYEVHYLGVVSDINMGSSRRRDTEAQLVDQIEAAQIEGRLPIAGNESNKVTIVVSKHGLNVLDQSKKVLLRQPLHVIVQLIMYEGGHGKPHVAVKIGQKQAQKKDIFHCHVFMCHSEDQAMAVCQTFKSIFDAVTI